MELHELKKTVDLNDLTHWVNEYMESNHLVLNKKSGPRQKSPTKRKRDEEPAEEEEAQKETIETKNEIIVEEEKIKESKSEIIVKEEVNEKEGNPTPKKAKLVKNISDRVVNILGHQLKRVSLSNRIRGKKAV